MMERVIFSAEGEGHLDIERFFREMEALSREFPGLPLEIRRAFDGPQAVISVREWLAPDVDLLAIDERIAAGPARFALRIDGIGGADDTSEASIGLQIVTRYQRLAPRRNARSRGALFDQTLERHRAMHDRSKPLVRADYDHALDTWQWLLRISPQASAAAQLAALFHDIERLASEADRRIEHRASDYQAFKARHSRVGAEIAERELASIGWGDAIARRTADLIAQHERPSGDPELALLNDADALSFFSLNSEGFARYFSPEHTAMKVAFTLDRMSPSARAKLSMIRHPASIARHLAAARRDPIASQKGRDE